MKRRYHDLFFLLVYFVLFQKRVPTAPSVLSGQCQLLKPQLFREPRKQKRDETTFYYASLPHYLSPLSAVSAILQMLRNWILYISRAMLSIFMDSLDTFLFCR